jgi:hypothetical protein
MTGLALMARSASGQYMFLDVDGDGAYTIADQYACADTLNIDIYLVTNLNQDGSPAACPSDGSGIDINSYSINLYANDAPTSFTNLTNQMPQMVSVDPPSVYPYALHVAYGGPLSFPPGKHRLFSFTAIGCTMLNVVPYSCYSPPGTVTSFGSSCPGVQSDYTLRLGEDWFGASGSGQHTDPIGSWPTVSCPSEITSVEGQPVSFPITVNDPDCTIWSFFSYGVPAGATVSTLGPFVAGDATATFHWTPGAGQAGTYAITFDASDYPNGFQGITQRDTCTTVITIRSTTAAAGGDLPVRVFINRENDSNGEPFTRFHIEPLVDAPFSPDKILPSTVALRYADSRCGDVDVHAEGTSPLTDSDHNGVAEYVARFSRDAMQTLESCFSSGAQTATLRLLGQLTDGSSFHGELTHTFVVAGGNLAAAITPNPLNRSSTLEFTTRLAGSMTARLFDIRGRFIATLTESRSLGPGTHRTPLVILESIRNRLASGIYFVRLTTEHDGEETKTVTILK